eukprot:2776379-Pyramimonas_sp.AAC.1
MIVVVVVVVVAVVVFCCTGWLGGVGIAQSMRYAVSPAVPLNNTCKVIARLPRMIQALVQTLHDFLFKG